MEAGGPLAVRLGVDGLLDKMEVRYGILLSPAAGRAGAMGIGPLERELAVGVMTGVWWQLRMCAA